jgi:dUTP pyrophosphatase
MDQAEIEARRQQAAQIRQQNDALAVDRAALYASLISIQSKLNDVDAQREKLNADVKEIFRSGLPSETLDAIREQLPPNMREIVMAENENSYPTDWTGVEVPIVAEVQHHDGINAAVTDLEDQACCGIGITVKIPVPIKRLPNSEGLEIKYQSALAAGMDLPAAVTEPVVIPPGQVVLIPTGFAFAVPPGYELQIRPRGSTPIKHGLQVANSPGTVDADYRGEVFIPLLNFRSEPFTVTRGMRLAQGVLAPVPQAELREVDDLEATVRGAGCVGSTGA